MPLDEEKKKFSPRLQFQAKDLTNDFPGPQTFEQRVGGIAADFRSKAAEQEITDSNRKRLLEGAAVLELVKQLVQKTVQNNGEIPMATAQELFELRPLPGEEGSESPERRAMRFTQRMELVRKIVDIAAHFPDKERDKMLAAVMDENMDIDLSDVRRAIPYNDFDRRDLAALRSLVMHAAHEYGQAIGLPKATLVEFQRNLGQLGAA